MGFIITLIFLCIFLILAIYIYYKEKSDELLTANKAYLKIDKGKIEKLRELYKESYQKAIQKSITLFVF